jgi:hypothetical protein
MHGCFEVVVDQYHISCILCNTASRSHSETNIGVLQGINIVDSVSSDCNVLLVQFFKSDHKEMLVLGNSSSQYSELNGDLFEFSFVLDGHSEVALTVSFSSQFSNELSEFLSSHAGVPVFGCFFLSDDACLNGNCLCSLQVVSTDHSDSQVTFSGILD